PPRKNIVIAEFISARFPAPTVPSARPTVIASDINIYFSRERTLFDADSARQNPILTELQSSAASAKKDDTNQHEVSPIKTAASTPSQKQTKKTKFQTWPFVSFY